MLTGQYSLSKAQKNFIIDKTDHYVRLANARMGLNLMSIDVLFDLKGKSSGMFVVSRGKACIRYNEIIFSQYYEDSLVNTVAHEVAHYVVYSKWFGKRVKPHGAEWKSVMDLYGVKPEVTSNYDVKDLPLRQQARHEYVCACMIHKLTTTRHNKIKKNVATYHCKKCKQPLRYNFK